MVCDRKLSGVAEYGGSRPQRANAPNLKHPGPAAVNHRLGVVMGQTGRLQCGVRAYLVEGGEVMDRRPRVTWFML